MQKPILLVLSCLLLACSKDAVETKPRIEIDSYNTKILPRFGDLVIDLQFRDKEGDLADGQFIYIPNRLNLRPVPADLRYIPVTLTIPRFPQQSKGSFSLKLAWRDLYKSDRGNDTINFKFVAIDQAGNRSDTVQSETVVILQQ